MEMILNLKTIPVGFVKESTKNKINNFHNSEKSKFLAISLSIIPGLGHFYLILKKEV